MRSRAFQAGLVLLVIWLAFGVRLIEMRGRNLWFDESIEFNVARRPIQQVIGADRDSTHDPPLFSLALNLWMNNGQNDFNLQMLPVFFSVLAVAAVYNLGRRLFSLLVGWQSALITAVAPRAVFYGQEVNQYALVLLLAALYPLLLERYLRRPSLVRLLPVVMTGAVAVLVHYELALYVAALALVASVYLIWHVQHIERSQLLCWIGGLSFVGLIGLGLFASYTLPQLAAVPEGTVTARFSTGPVSLVSEVQNWLLQTVEIVRFLFWGFEPTDLKWFTVALLILGIITGSLFHTNRRVVAYLAASLLVGYIAAGSGFWWYAHRYLWYAFPLCALLISAGVRSLSFGRMGRYGVLLSWGAAAILIGLLISYLPLISGKPFFETEQLGDVVKYVEAHRQSSDAIYVYYGARLAFTRYADPELVSVAVVEEWIRNWPAQEQKAKMWAVMGGKARAWILFTHVYPGEDSNLLSRLNKKCRQIDEVKSAKAAGYLFDCATAE